MKAKFVFLIFIALTFTYACGSRPKPLAEKNQLIEKIADVEKQLYRLDTINKSLADSIIELYVYYANKFPQDSLSPEYLFKAAEIGINSFRAKDAIDFLTRIENNYKSFDKYVSCLFLKAFIYENYLKDFENAKKYYQLIIDKYPEHKLAKDAEAAIIYIGIDDLELVKLFEKAQ